MKKYSKFHMAYSIAFLLLSFTATAQKSNNPSNNGTYFLETDLLAENKKSQLSDYKIENKKLLSKIKKGDKSAELKMNVLKKDMKETQGAINGLTKLSKKFYSSSIKRDINPPCPKPRDCEKIKELGGLYVPREIKEVYATVLDKNKKNIGKLENKPVWKDNKTGVRVYNFKLTDKYSGPIYINISRTDANGAKENYNHKVFLERF